MPFTHTSQLSENVMLGYWKMTESPDELLRLMHADAFDAKAYEKLLNDKARKQWLSARLLLKEMCGDDARIVYDSYGKPHCQGFSGISISHSADYVLLAINTLSEIGADIEFISNRIERITHKFLSAAEDQLQYQLADYPANYFFHLIWSFKEAAYKLYGKKGLIFKEHIVLKQLDLEHAQLHGGLLVNGVERAVKGQFMFREGYVVCLCYYA